MNFFSEEPFLWCLVGAIIFIELIALTAYYFKKARRKKAGGNVSLNSVRVLRSLGKDGVLLEIERLRAGGEMNETLMRNLSVEDKALFEIALIDALTKWSREDQHRLRSTLVKHGYDEQCARRVMIGSLTERIRASTLIDLLRPQSHPRRSDSGPLNRRDTGSLINDSTFKGRTVD